VCPHLSHLLPNGDHPASGGSPMSDEDIDIDAELGDLIAYLKRSRGFDLTGYKRPGLLRRVQKRIGSLKIDSVAAYTDYLEVHPDEFDHLFDTILINVTSFFRDEAVWDAVRKDIVPKLIDSKPSDETIRV
jgi:two-component system CheB/CheR fusion protein